jgi:hypothetical protein
MTATCHTKRPSTANNSKRYTKMPVRLSLGLTKKIGLPHYSSVGASCHVEIELDHAVLDQDLERFHKHVRRAYLACAEAVHDELTRQQSSPAEAGGAAQPRNGNAEPSEAGHALPPATLRASGRQLNFARQLAGKISGVGLRRLECLATARFQQPLADLSACQASELIELLKQLRAGKVDLELVLEEACC